MWIRNELTCWCGLMIFGCAALFLLLSAVGCQNNGEDGSAALMKVGHASVVEDDMMTREFNNLFRDGDVYFAGLPTEAGLRMAEERGVGLVINVISVPESKTRIRFDERKLVEQLGMKYVFIPVTPGSFSIGDVDKFTAALASIHDDEKILIHCASSNRAGGIWAAYLARKLGMSEEEALARGREAGLNRESMVGAVKRVIEE